jgi:CRP-like cAMP-binding protein
MDPYQLIDQHIAHMCAFSPTDIEYFHSLLKVKRYPKKTFLLKEGEVSNMESFIVKGCVRSYFINDKGDEVTLQFGIEGWWIGDVSSFYDRTPSHMFIETLEDSDLLYLTPETKEQLLTQVPGFERFFRILVQRNVTALQDRLFKTIATDGAQKYLDFLKKYPTIPQRVPQHYIASYLGFTPEFLSRIRKRLASGN